MDKVHKAERMAAKEPIVREWWVEAVCRDVAELPDRTSPEGLPNMMLVTVEELASIIVAHAPADLSAKLAEAERERDTQVLRAKAFSQHLDAVSDVLPKERDRVKPLFVQVEDELKALRAQLAAAVKEKGEAISAANEWRDEMHTARAQLAAAVEALKRYGRHEDGCEVTVYNNGEWECSCGLMNAEEAALAQAAPGEAAERSRGKGAQSANEWRDEMHAANAQLAAAMETLRDARPYVEIEASEQDSMTVKDALELLRKIDAALAQTAPGEAAERSRGK